MHCICTWPSFILTCGKHHQLYSHRRRSGWNSGGTHDQGRRWIGAEWGRVCGGVYPLQLTRGSGGASWAPPAESGAEPRPKTDSGVFWRSQNAHFCTNMTKSAGDNLHYRPTLLQILEGRVPPVPPWSTPKFIACCNTFTHTSSSSTSPLLVHSWRKTHLCHKPFQS